MTRVTRGSGTGASVKGLPNHARSLIAGMDGGPNAAPCQCAGRMGRIGGCCRRSDENGLRADRAARFGREPDS